MLSNIILFVGFVSICIFVIMYARKFTNYKFLKTLSNYCAILAILLLITTIIVCPAQSVDAAYEGLTIWATLVIPALLPFFIGSELLINLGVVKYIGAVLEPIMRPIFNVPGEGSFALIMSTTSGYLVGAKIVARFRSEKILTRIEAQRLISFCNTSGPLFMIGSVAIGMFSSLKLGAFIAVSHYLGTIIVGMVFRFYKKSPKNNKIIRKGENSIKKTYSKVKTNNNQNPTTGIGLGGAVKNSLDTILMVGGFITLFAVVVRMLELLKITDLITSVIVVLSPLKISSTVVNSLITGLFEVTVGTKSVVDNISICLHTKIAIVSFIIGWGGFSIHSQVASILEDTDISLCIYMVSQALHGLFSSLIAYMFFPVFSKYFLVSYPVFSTYQSPNPYRRFLSNLKLSVELFIMVLIGLLFLSLILASMLKIRNYIIRKRKY